MTDTATKTSSSARTWRSTQAYVVAMVALALGIGMGYLGRGNMRDSSAMPSSAAIPKSPTVNNSSRPDRPSLDQMKHMADKKAEPLIEQLKTQPNNAALLAEVAHIYLTTHQFKEAVSYYEKSLKADPKNVGVRADFASCLFYTGDVDKSIAALEEALRYDPHSAQVLFNLGMVRWKGKDDSAGAIVLWNRLLKTNPTLPSARRQAVESLIAQARQGTKSIGAIKDTNRN